MNNNFENFFDFSLDFELVFCYNKNMEKNDVKKPKPLRIGEVSELYDVPIPTLRFWEKEGLCPSRRDVNNNYRIYDPSDTLINLGDTVFYRNIEIPFSDVKRIKSMDSAELTATLQTTKENIQAKIENYKQKMEVIEQKLAIIKEIQNAKKGELVETEIPFDRVIAFEYNKKEHFQKYLSNPNCFISINETSKGLLEDMNGIAVEPDYPGKVIFEKNKDDRYLMSYCNNEIHKYNYQFENLIHKLQKEYGITSTQYILQFLINMVDENGDCRDYYKVWFKIQ